MAIVMREVTLTGVVGEYAHIAGDGFEAEIPVGGFFGTAELQATDEAGGCVLWGDDLRNVGETFSLPVKKWDGTPSPFSGVYGG